METNTKHTPAYLVKYVSLGNPIPDETYPEYNAGYEETEHCEIMFRTKDEIFEIFAEIETEGLQIIGPISNAIHPELIARAPEMAAELERVKADLHNLICKEQNP